VFRRWSGYALPSPEHTPSPLILIDAEALKLIVAQQECLRRSTLEGQTFEGRQANLTQAAKLSRTYALLVDTLDRHRGGGTQKIIVERVTVNAGGQAVVGAIMPGPEGVQAKHEEQPHAKQLTHAPVTTLPGLDALRDAVPVARDVEWALPDARWSLLGSTKG
jgi:hypothetical protein